MTWEQFTAQPNGSEIYNHYANECVALANQYHEQVLGGSFVPVNSAYNWWTDYGRLAQLWTMYTQSQTPVPGAVAVWKGGRYDSTHGHIGVVTGLVGSSYTTMEQNAESNRYLYRYTRDRANLLGFLIPKNNPAEPKPKTSKKWMKKMLGLQITDGAGKYGQKNAQYFATYDGRAFVSLTRADANAISVFLGVSFANVTYSAWEAYKSSAEVVS